jgi:hypothetical protein
MFVYPFNKTEQLHGWVVSGGGGGGGLLNLLSVKGLVWECVWGCELGFQTEIRVVKYCNNRQGGQIN